LGVDAFNALPISPTFFRFLSKSLRTREFDLNQAQIVKKKGDKEETRFLSLNNRFYTIPDSETQIALVGFNGNTKVTEIEKKVIDTQVGDSLLSVRRWATYPVKESVTINRTQKRSSKRTTKRATAKKTTKAGKKR